MIYWIRFCRWRRHASFLGLMVAELLYGHENVHRGFWRGLLRAAIHRRDVFPGVPRRRDT